MNILIPVVVCVALVVVGALARPAFDSAISYIKRVVAAVRKVR